MPFLGKYMAEQVYIILNREIQDILLQLTKRSNKENPI